MREHVRKPPVPRPQPAPRRPAPAPAPAHPAPDPARPLHALNPASIIQMQSLVGNAATQRLIMRQSAAGTTAPLQLDAGHVRFVKTHCIARTYPKRLGDAELAEAIAALKQDMLARDPTDALYLQAAENLQILTAEVDYRKREQTVSDHLQEIGDSTKEADHRRETDELMAYARGLLDDYPPKVDLFLQQTSPDADEKVRILGKVTAAAARMEFLLGSIYHKGAANWEVDAKGKKTSNKGHMVDYYTGGSAMEWCSRFATTALSKVRGQSGLLAASGYKIANPTEFKNLNLDYDEASGGDFAGMTSGATATAKSNPFAALRENLVKIDKKKIDEADKQQQRQEQVDQLFADHIKPQPGDIMIVRRGSAKANAFSAKSQSHTTMIERVDGYQISTIEGNTGKGRIAGHVFDLLKPADVEEIIFIARPSLSSGLSKEQKANIGKGTPAGTPAVTEAELLEPIDQLNALLQRFAAAAASIKQPGAGEADTVANLS